MASKTDEQLAKENRLRIFREEGTRALEEAAEKAVAARKNMARLRELRLGSEQEAASNPDLKAKQEGSSK